MFVLPFVIFVMIRCWLPLLVLIVLIVIGLSVTMCVELIGDCYGY